MDEPTTADRQRWQEWREQRDDQFGQPYGWLSLTALHWLELEPTALEGLPGLWWEDQGVHFDPDGDADTITLAGEPVTSARLLWNPADGPAPSVSHGERHLELILRDGFLGVRVRDPHSPGLQAYTGVPAFDYDPAWRLTGHYRPYAASQQEAIGSAAARVKLSAQVTGEVDLAVGGANQTLKVTGGGGSWLISFRDPGHPKFRWIVLDAEPATDLVVDFNFAANPPCAFTDFGTCPLPPAGNVMAAAVSAGEQNPR